MNLYFGLFYLSSLLSLTLSDGKEYTVEVKGGQRECYWETLTKLKDNRHVAVEYQVRVSHWYRGFLAHIVLMLMQ